RSAACALQMPRLHVVGLDLEPTRVDFRGLVDAALRIEDDAQALVGPRQLRIELERLAQCGARLVDSLGVPVSERKLMVSLGARAAGRDRRLELRCGRRGVAGLPQADPEVVARLR